MRRPDAHLWNWLSVPHTDNLFDCEQAAPTPTRPAVPESRHSETVPLKERFSRRVHIQSRRHSRFRSPKIHKALVIVRMTSAAK